MSSTSIRFEESGGIAVLTLSRPDKLNTFTAAMHAEIKTVFTRLQASDTVRCLVITGEGRGFCAGQDLADLDMAALGNVVEDHYNPLIRAVTNLQVPVIAAVNGVAAGAGANLALACDIVIAGRSARFIQSFNHVGLVPDAGGTWTLPKLVGLPRAMALALTGEPVSAEQAAEWGMIWQCVDDEALQSTVEALASKISKGAPVALGYTKLLLRQGLNRTLSEQLDQERDFQSAASKTDDFKIGIDAFLAKQRPEFTGR